MLFQRHSPSHQTAEKQLAHRLATHVVLVSLAVGLAMSLLANYLDLLGSKRFFRSTIQQVIQTNGQTAARAAYNLNADLAGEVAQGLLEYNTIIDVTILDDRYNVLSSQIKEVPGKKNWLIQQMFGGLHHFEIELRTLDDPEVKAGYLQVIANPAEIAGTFLNRAFAEMAFQLIQSLLVAAILSLVYYHLLVRPLLGISTALANADPDKPKETRLKVPLRNEGDELYVLAQSGNRLLDCIATRGTERDRAEDALRKSAETLEERIAERTAELEKQFLAAQAANRAKQEFLASMSHEIRTPMTAVMGLADLLLENHLVPENQEKVEKIKEATQSLLVIINDILDLSKIEAGKFELEQIDFEFRPEIRKTLEIIEARAAEKNLSLELNIAPDVPEGLHGDPTRLRQILINLLGNAVKFTHQGGIELEITRGSSPHPVEAQEQNKKQTINQTEDKSTKDGPDPIWLMLRVSDSGIGIPVHILPELFNEFTQADASISRQYEGTGLGLAISHRLAEHMGGSITVESTVGEGSTFTVKLPLAPVTSPLAKINPAPATAYQTRRPLRILVVDDNRLNQRIISSIMEKYGHSITLANDGQEAVELISSFAGLNSAERNHPRSRPEEQADTTATFELCPELILMDVRMPVMSGPEATRAIRKLDHEMSHIPIVALTADAMEDHVVEYLEAGMNAFVAKPIDHLKLLQVINQVMAAEIHQPVPAPLNDTLAKPALSSAD
ncbi:ATP-binding protein [Kiloniella laminariae]|uniref:histidine kinase n=1 Tax=Kiloniella laminariae TaxID=454162 RepID=A0ABT4LEU0_9PROT|nr:ATP-binding protein [Kiloniella laminariae]MCZ4279623.1 ATP-binding protein [Kiloniella laminariae]